MLDQLRCISKYRDIFNNRNIIIHDNRFNKFEYRPTLAVRYVTNSYVHNYMCGTLAFNVVMHRLVVKSA